MEGDTQMEKMMIKWRYNNHHSKCRRRIKRDQRRNNMKVVKLKR